MTSEKEIKRATLLEVEKFLIKKIREQKRSLAQEKIEASISWDFYDGNVKREEGSLSTLIALKISVSKWRKKLTYADELPSES